MDKHDLKAREIMHECPVIISASGKPVYLYSREEVAAALRAVEAETIAMCVKFLEDEGFPWHIGAEKLRALNTRGASVSDGT